MTKFQIIILLTCISMLSIKGFIIQEIHKRSLHAEMINRAYKPHASFMPLETVHRICPSAFTKADETLSDINKCAENINKTDFSFCMFHLEFLKCLDPLIHKCSSKENKDLMVLFLQTDTSVTYHLCTTGFSNESHPCVDESLDKCGKEIEDFFQNDTQPLSRSKVCSNAFTLRGCMRTQMELSCENTNTVDTAMAVVEALIAPCSYIYEENKIH